MTWIAIWGALKRYWQIIPCIVLLVALMLTRASLASVKTERDLAKASLAQTEANYRAAAAQRKAEDLINVERVKAEQSTISEEVRSDYAKRIDAIRANFARRVQLATSTDTRSPGATNLPATSEGTAGVAETACDTRLPQRQALIASEQAIQLDALITWVEKQARVDNSGAAHALADNLAPVRQRP